MTSIKRFSRRVAADLGLYRNENLYWYYKPSAGINFGDWIGPYLFAKIRGHAPHLHNPKRRSLAKTTFTCGSILSHIKKPDAVTVWGSGAISSDVTFPRPETILAVRGPLSRQICLRQGYSCPEVYGDPGLLLPRYYLPKGVRAKFRVGLIPHYVDLQHAKEIFCGGEDLNIIDVKQSVEKVVDEIMSCECIVSTSLHGLIVAHAYGVPAAFGKMSDQIIGGSFKFQDYFLGAGFSTLPRPLEIARGARVEDLAEAALRAPRLKKSRIADELLELCPI